MDGGNREEEDLRHMQGPGLAVASSSQSPYPTYSHDHDSLPAHLPPSRQQHAAHPDDSSNPRADPHHDILHESPTSISVTTYAARNFHAVASNATFPAQGGAFGSPDDFYRSYRGVDIANDNSLATLAHDPMASAVPNTRQPPSSRSNSNAASSKPPAGPGTRVGTRPMYRSASNPVDDRFAATDGTRMRSATGTGNGNGLPASTVRASVKDMKKKFEQKGTQPSPEPRRVVSRTNNNAKDGAVNGTNGRAAVGSAQSYSSLRTTGANSARSNSSRGTQRTKFLAEDQVSTNSQSFASRINRPKGAAASTASTAHASRSMTHLSPTASPIQQPNPIPSDSEGPLLFGEIRQGDLDAETPGYGIGILPDPTADNPMWQHQRTQSDAVAEPASPTDWYRGATSPQRNGLPDLESPGKSHSRSQSDLAGAKLPPINTNAQLRRHIDQSPSPHASSSSRLPVSVKKLSSTSSPASPASTRSNSPAGSRRVAPSGRTSRQQGTPTSRAKTPVTRSKTPTAHTPSARKTATPTPGSNGARLAAAISPAPKNSPPLRSSRPRQPVSEATTAASRLKVIDRSKSPHKNALRPTARPESRQETPSSRRRKLSLGGPVDFAERRETIKLKYSKSIRETEAKQAREAAAERRKKELEAAAKAKARAKARAQAQAAAAEAAAASARAKEQGKSSEPIQHQEPEAVPRAVPTGEQSLAGDVKTPPSPVRANPPALVLDSPTLGLPGTFPSFGSPPLDQDEAPPSAISETSAITEFDNEAQTEPPVPEQSVHAAVPQRWSCVSSAEVGEQPPPQLTPAYQRATYRDPFEDIVDHETVSIKISLDPSSPRPSAQETLPDDGFDAEPQVPGAFGDDLEPESECESQHYLEHRADAEPEPETAGEHLTEAHIKQPALGDRQEYEYEPQPYVAQPYQTTTVTIISRDAGFGPPTYAEQAARNMLPPDEPRMDSLEEFYTGPRLHDNISSLRDSTFTASDAGTSEEPSGSADAHNTPDTSNSLNVPSMTTPANRSSQQSIWTDISYSSRDSMTRRLDYLDEQIHSGADESRPHSVRDDESTYQHRYLSGGFGHDRDDDTLSDRHHLPHLDTGSGLSGHYGTENGHAPYVPRLPDHAPPPPPEDASRPTSGYYDGHSDSHRPDSALTRDDQMSISFPISRRDSEEYHNQSSTSQSPDGRSLATDSATPAQTPIEGEGKTTENADDKPESGGKGKNRLHQRSMVIKELVDTEAVFVRDMNVIEEIYKGTAEACPQLDDKTIKLIFRNTDEIINFHTTFLGELKDGVTSVYVPKGRRSPVMKEDTTMSDATTIRSIASTTASAVPSTAASSTTAVSLSGTTAINGDTEDAKDRQTIIGPAFVRNIEQMKAAHEGFLRTSDVANKRLIDIQQDPTVKVWLNECNEVAKDLTAAWNLDSLLIKPMQRITKYPNLISQLLQYTPEDHPDREGLLAARATVENAILDINKTKKNFELVGQIVGRKRKESDVKAGFARAFGKRVDKLQTSSNRPPEDPDYLKFNEKFSDDYLRLQVVLRDVEFYTRQVSTYVQAFLDYLSAIELVTRLQPGPYPELESKWVQFNVSMRDIKKVALDQHLLQIRKHVIEPFELVIRSYQNPLLAMKKRNKRRLDYEKSVQLKKGGKKLDKQLAELVEHYEALNDTLKKELPQLSALTEKVGNICLENMINIQAKWWLIWQEKIRAIASITDLSEVTDIVSTFNRDFRDMEEQIMGLGILNPTVKTRTSQSTTDDTTISRMRSKASDLGTPRGRGLSVTSDQAPTLPTPDFIRQHSGQLARSPSAAAASSSSYFYRDYYHGLNSRGPASPTSSDFSNPPRSFPAMTPRPGTGRSFDSAGVPRPSIDSAAPVHVRRDSNSASNAPPSASDGRRGSGLFHSAMPLTESTEELQRSSRASSRERYISKGYNVLWLAASLFEFNIETTKHEAGYPYLTYQAGEIFDVIAEKGELWLAKNQDDPDDLVGWIWSKHFAKLADS